MDVDEKALRLIDGWEASHYRGQAQKKAALQVAIIKALREQDQRTRSACAEAVAAVPATTGSGYHIKRQARAACLSARTL